MYELTHFNVSSNIVALNRMIKILCPVCGVLTVQNERKNMLQVCKCNDEYFFLQAKTLLCTTHLIHQLFTSKCIVNHNSPINSEYIVMLSRPVCFIPLSASLDKN